MNIKLSGPTIHLEGRFTFAQHGTFQRALSHLETVGAQQVRIDLSAVDFIDSAGLGMLLIARDVARERGIGLILRGARGAVATMLETASFDALFTLEAA